MSDSFYASIDPGVLNQGDIVDHVPWGLINAPTTLCRPSNRQVSSGKAFYGSVEEPLKPAPWTHEPEFIHAVAHEGMALVLWHGCQIDKWKNRGLAEEKIAQKAFVAIAPIIELGAFQPVEKQPDVMAGKQYALFPLPSFTAGERTIPNSYVDLRHIWSVRQSSLNSRLASLSQTALNSLYAQLFTFFTRFRLDTDPICPTCGISVPLVPAVDEGEAEG